MRTLVGFGFGPIQAGLFALEAQRSGRFERLVLAEISPELNVALRATGGRFTVNVATKTRIEHERIGPVEVLNPSDHSDRDRLVAAIADADEIATAIPSVALYSAGGPGSVAQVFARGLEQRSTARPLVVYTAENNNHAAELLRDAVRHEIESEHRERLELSTVFLNTVIGKMSGVVTQAEEIRASGLSPITPSLERAILVEEFNRILVSRPLLPDGTLVERGLVVFEEKDDLLPFEEAKLYGHNACHALAAYLAAERGLELLSDVPTAAEILRAVTTAFHEECGVALVAKHAGVDPLFTAAGMRAYADDLLDRMFRPLLRDRVERVARDPRRKLGWSDRLVGACRLALDHDVEPRELTRGVHAALTYLDPTTPMDAARRRTTLVEIWRGEGVEAEGVEAEAAARVARRLSLDPG